MSDVRSYRDVRKPWIEGGGTLCFGIPFEIVKKLNLNQDSLLLVDLIDESVIVIKKHDPQFTKNEINKITSHENETKEKFDVIGEKSESIGEEFVNPLKDLNL